MGKLGVALKFQSGFASFVGYGLKHNGSRKFASHKELYQFMLSIAVLEYFGYQVHAGAFLMNVLVPTCEIHCENDCE